MTRTGRIDDRLLTNWGATTGLTDKEIEQVITTLVKNDA